MATGMVLTVVQTLICAMQTKEFKEICSLFGHESRLAELGSTVETIKAVLLDAESKHQELNKQGLDWLDKLKDAVYDADDLFDEFNTIAQQQERIMSSDKVFNEVRRFFSGDNRLLFAAKTSRKIKKLRNKLDSIAKDHAQFGFTDVYVPVKRREETSSYVYEPSIIGRDADKEAILGLLLLDSDAVQDNVSFVSIVGIGGLGKTAVAQFVFQDERIKSAFELSLWVCVSEEFGMKQILSKMLGTSTELNIEELQKEVRRQIEGKRYFLVLDDVWKEDHNEWMKLKEFLLLGARGSRIIVTTRSKRVARAIGEYPMHELGGLSDEDAWCLFESIAFTNHGLVDAALVDIGKDIVKKCANVPLSIRVVGSMLYDQDKSNWLLFQRIDLANMDQGEGGILPILKFSYYQLTPALKSCFSYCSLFPKDFVIKKELLLNLWLAEGCLECSKDMQSIEHVGEQYFSILLHRCFFQDMKEDEYGEIYSVKMHDLIHDLAKEVAGKESCLVMDSSTRHLSEKIRHVSFDVQHPILSCPSDNLGKLKTVRTLLRSFSGGEYLVSNTAILPDSKYWESKVPEILANWKRLRVLDLHGVWIKAFDNTLNCPSLLRYLDLSGNGNLERLPKSMSKLHNLQVLNLNGCSRLKELPEDLTELVNLRHLDITGCDALTHMPAGMGNLTGLCTLTMYVVGGESSNQRQKGQLRELIPLINIKGEVKIEFTMGYSYNVTNVEEGSYLLNKKHIKSLIIMWDDFRFWIPNLVERPIIDQRLLESLQPHHDLKKIEIKVYKSCQLPSWAATLASSLPLLVSICLWDFQGLQHLPKLSQLCHLKTLVLGYMPNVEYMEDDNVSIPFFPSLEDLSLSYFPKLKGWWRLEVGVEREAVFPRLHNLKIEICPNLTSFPGIPHVKIISRGYLFG